MRSRIPSLFGFLLCAMLLATAGFADVPHTISYQGRLTTPSGDPVADGAYNVTFQVWDMPVGGLSLWSSGVVSVTTSEGIFSVQLGAAPQPPFPANLFDGVDRYLGVTVGFDPEIAPRTPFNSSAYSLRTETVDGTTGGTITGDLRLSDGFVDYVQTDQVNNQLTIVGDDGGPKVIVSGGGNYGEVVLFDNFGLAQGSMQAPFGGAASLLLFGPFGACILDPAVPGDLSVSLPFDAINSFEMFNEPGLASAVRTWDLIAAPGVFEDVVKVSIFTPADGYIFLQADGEILTFAPAGVSSVVRFGLGEVSGGFPANGFYWEGLDPDPGLFRTYTQYSTSAVYFKPAGSYDFYLTATRSDAGQFAGFYEARLKAIYIPTSYGPVTIPAPLAGGAIEADPLAERQRNRNPELIDLRQLELEAARLKAEAQEAENKLLRARLQESAEMVSGKN